MEQYDNLAKCYDALNSEVDYYGFAENIDRIFKENGIKKGSLVLDLACGTGNVTLPLLSLGYDMIGVDLSEGMLNIARGKKDADKVLWLCQDMREFELYGTVAGVCCCLDSINYLTKKEDLYKCFSLVHNYLDPDGVFSFDVNSKYKFEEIYGNNDYILETENVYCGWRNSYNEKTKNCDFELTLFTETSNGIKRFDEYQREHYWSDKIIKEALTSCGFEIVSVCGDFDGSEPTETTERIFYTAKCIK